MNNKIILICCAWLVSITFVIIVTHIVYNGLLKKCFALTDFPIIHQRSVLVPTL